MPLTLSPGGASDGPGIGHAYVSAFSNDPIHIALLANLPYDAQHAWFTESYPVYHNHPQFYVQKVTDTETGKVAAMARWMVENVPVELLRRLRPDATIPDGEGLPPLPAVDLPEGHNKELMTGFRNNTKNNKVKYMGDRPVLYLKLLATDPTYHRRGAAAMMLKWMCEFADAEDIYCWVEGTEMARPLYERHGFVMVEPVCFKWDGREAMYYCMARAPRGKPLELDSPASVANGTA